MRAVVQRVSRAKVTVAGEITGEIGAGLLVFLGVLDDDTQDDASYLAEKVVSLRIFPDDEGKMNLSLADVGGRMLVVSQFTLLGDCRKGRRLPDHQRHLPHRQRRVHEALHLRQVHRVDL